ncbi:MAG: diguanylate cyclase [Pseudomonadota bacterium]
MQLAILTFIIPIISLIFTCAFLALWWNDRKQWPTLAFAACFGSLALGIAINIWLIEHTTGSGIIAYHVVSMSGMIALMWGIGKRADVAMPIMFSALTVPIVSVALWFAVQLGQLDAMRLIQNTNSAVVTALIAVSMWYGTKHNWADRALMWVLIVLATFGFARPALTLLFAALPGEEGAGMIILNAIHILMLATLLTLIALCLIASIVYGTMQRERDYATTDPLTGLPNRAAFEERVRQTVEQARKEAVPVSLLVGDIDNFKSVNDTWGHSAGDKVIAKFGSLIENRIRGNDVAGRIGGEEFCVLIWNCSEAGAVSLANRLRLGFSNAHISGFSSEQRFTVSFGVAEWRPGETYEQAFGRADGALYEAKRAGRNRVQGSSAHAGSSTVEERRSETSAVAPGIAPFRSGGDVVSFDRVRANKPQ